MNLPTPKHIETRRRELSEGATALLGDCEGLSIITTVGKPLPCGCCRSTATGITNTTKDDTALTLAIGGAMRALINSLVDTDDGPPSEADILLVSTNLVSIIGEITAQLLSGED